MPRERHGCKDEHTQVKTSIGVTGNITVNPGNHSLNLINVRRIGT